MSVISVQMVKIPVQDVSRSVSFYRDVIGLNEDFVMVDYGWAQLSADNLLTDVTQLSITCTDPYGDRMWLKPTR